MATEVGQLVLKVDTSEVKAGEAAVERLGDAAVDASAKTDRLQKTTKKSNVVVGDFGRKAGMAGIQIEQMAGQVAMGVNPMRALGVQAADLGFILGFPLLGAVVGIGAALGSVLIPMLLDTGKTAEDLVEELDDLDLHFKEMTSAQKAVFLMNMNEELEELEEQSENARQRLEELAAQRERLEGRRRGESAVAGQIEELERQEQIEQAIIDNNERRKELKLKALEEETDAERKARQERERAEKDAERQAEREAAILERRTEAAQRHAEKVIAMNDTPLEALQRREDQAKAILEQSYAEKLISEEQYQAAKTALEAAGIQARFELKAQEMDEERRRAEEKLERLHEENDLLMEGIIEQDNKRKEAAAMTNQALLGLEDVLLKGKSEKQKAGFRLAVNLANEEKRENAKSIISNSYDAAMKAYKSLAGIPIVGPALGAAAAATILAAGVSFAASSLSGRALGGQVRAGESYLVGERGPEILTMGTGGRITPNEAIRGGAQQIVNKNANVSFNIQANDTEGFDNLLNSRRGVLIGIINEALNDNGRTALV